MKKPIKKLLDSLKPKDAGDRYRANLAALDAETQKLQNDRAAAEAALEEAVSLGEDGADLANRIVATEAKLSAVAIRRAPLGKLIAEADEAERLRLEAEKRARWKAALTLKRTEGLTFRIVAVGALREAADALARLDVLEREAEALGDRLGCHGLDFDALPDSIAADAGALHREEHPDAWQSPGGPLFLTLNLPRLILPATDPE